MKSVLRTAWVLTALLALLPGAASAAGYQIGEDTPLKAAPSTSPEALPGAGPIRLARFSLVQGSVSWRAGDGAAWSPASVNLPLQQGAQIRVTDGGRAEVQFDDGSLLRFGHGAVATLQTLYSDEDGEFTELNLSEGLLSLELRDSPSIYQINTPFVSVKSEGPSKVRIGVDSSIEVAVRLGKATVEGDGAKTTLSRGDYLNIPAESSAFDIHLMPDKDRWDRFNDDRDRQLADPESERRLPPDIARVVGNLSAYGTWHEDLRYGAVWSPRETDAGWRPYQHGHWVWVDPFGWTWVSDEAWGWAPYHYGTWVSEPYGWAWVPGPAQQYWCPAIVGFSEDGDEVAWAPLAPGEVHYPVYLAHCYRDDDWADFFSIGGAAVYYPDDGYSCHPRPFSNAAVNTPSIPGIVRRPGGGTIVNRYIHPLPAGFVPTNARRYPGVTVARKTEFGAGGHSSPVAAGGAFWTRGRAVRAPTSGASPVSGPISVQPAAQAVAASQPGASSGASARSVYRASLPERVARVAPPLPKDATPRAVSDTDTVPAEPDAPPIFVRPIFVPPFFIRPAASSGARQNTPAARLPVPTIRPSAPPASVLRAEPSVIRIILPREAPLPPGAREPEPQRDDRRESQPERRDDRRESQPERRDDRRESQPEHSAPRSEERPQEQHAQEQHTQEQHAPPPSDKQEAKPDDKKDDAREPVERGGGRAR